MHSQLWQKSILHSGKVEIVKKEEDNLLGKNVLFAGHSMGCVLSQRLTKENLPERFYYAGSAPYLWSETEFSDSEKQKWFSSENDIFTKTVGTGFEGSVKGWSVKKMEIELKEDPSKKDEHKWEKYMDMIKKYLSSNSAQM